MKRSPSDVLNLSAGQRLDGRQMWANTRFWLETHNLKTGRYGYRSRHHWTLFLTLLRVFELGLRFSGLYRRGRRNAEQLEFKILPLYFSNLPEPFEGFRILHLSDLHLDGMPRLMELVHEQLLDEEFDLCVITGDFRADISGSFQPVMDLLGPFLEGIRTIHGILGVLGNHDSCLMVEPLEALGIRMLINEEWEIEKSGERIQLIGVDDVHAYYTDQTLQAFSEISEDFAISLVHSPELYDVAAQMGVNLYLCGHTHAGQIVLPGGVAPIKHLHQGKAFYRGHWFFKGMQGVTSAGVGTSGIPVRFNTRGELLVLELHRGKQLV